MTSPDRPAERAGSSDRHAVLRRQLASAAGWIAAAERGRRLGELATLRRMARDPAALPPASFWSVIAQLGSSPHADAFWRSVLPLMVDVPHARGRRPGHACRAAGVSAARVERWLRLDRDAAAMECRRFLQRLDGGVDWVELGTLLHDWTDAARLRFARDYYVPTRAAAAPAPAIPTLEAI